MLDFMLIIFLTSYVKALLFSYFWEVFAIRTI
jgi:hypothetical protein